MKKIAITIAILFVTTGIATAGVLTDDSCRMTAAQPAPVAAILHQTTECNLAKDASDMAAHFVPVAQSAAIQVASSPDNELHPDLAAAGLNYLAGYSRSPSIVEKTIIWATSSDGGQTFADGGSFTYEGIQDYPTCDHWDGSTFYGLFQSAPGTAITPLITFEDIASPDTWAGSGWEWSDDGWYDLSPYDIACSNTGTDLQFGVAAYIGSTTYSGGEGENVPHIFFTHPEDEGSGWISWQPAFPGCEHSAAAVDKATNMMWGVYDYFNETTGSWNLIFWKRDFLDPLADGATKLFAEIPSQFNAQYPSVVATNDNIAILYQSEEPGSHDILCARSSDGGETWETSDVATSAGSEIYPDATLTGTSIICSFMRDGNLYYTESSDLGATWSEAVQVNDNDGTVTSEWRAHQASSVGAIWADEGAGNSDVYFNAFPTAILAVELSGGFGITAAVENIGALAAEDVPYSITLDGGLVLLGQEKTGTFNAIPAGGSASVSSFALGIGRVTVTVSVGSASATAEGFLLGPLLLGLQ